MILIFAFLLPALMYVIVMAATGMFPFGDNALLISDINNQFAAFFTYFKHTLVSNDNLIYSFSKGLGGDMIGFSGYYLRNPFLFLLLFFKDAYIPVGIVMIIGLQISLMGLTMALLLKDIHRSRISSVLLFSTSYAFMGYVFAYITLPIYLCDLILLPLVILGIRHIMRGKKTLYIITLALAILTNYYMGYMIVIFSFLYFIRSMIAEGRFRRKKTYIDYVISAALAVGLSAFWLIPTVVSLRGQKDLPGTDTFDLHVNYGIKQLVRNLFVGGFRGDLSNYCAPYIYVGEVVLAFAVIYMLSDRIRLRERVADAALLFILLLSTYLSTLDVVWHGFNAPVGFAYRYAYLISAVLIIMAYTVYINYEDKIPRFIIAVQLILLLVNAVISVRSYSSTSLSDYVFYHVRASGPIDHVKEDGSLYRMEKDYEYNHNDAMLFAYNGLTHNSSCDTAQSKEFLGRMGIRYFEPIWTFYNQGSTTFVDSFLGVKYLISRFDQTFKPYESDHTCVSTDKNGDEYRSYVYKNPYALPLCFGTDDERLNVDTDNENLFEIQNQMAGVRIYDSVSEDEALIRDVTTDEDISLDVTVSKSCNLYFYATAPDYQGAELLVNDWSYDDYFSVSRWNIIHIGYYNEGDRVNIKIRPTDGMISVNAIYVYEEDLNALAGWYEKASKDKGSLLKISSSHLKGNIDITDSSRILFTIPYDEGWNIMLNGKKASPEPAFGALMSVPVSPGDYEIEMTFIPRGLVAGSIVSLITLFISLVFLIKDLRPGFVKRESI